MSEKYLPIKIFESRTYVDAVIPYADASLAAEIHRKGQFISEEYKDDGIHIKAYVPRELASKRFLSM